MDDHTTSGATAPTPRRGLRIAAALTGGLLLSAAGTTAAFGATVAALRAPEPTSGYAVVEDTSSTDDCEGEQDPATDGGTL